MTQRLNRYGYPDPRTDREYHSDQLAGLALERRDMQARRDALHAPVLICAALTAFLLWSDTPTGLLVGLVALLAFGSVWRIQGRELRRIRAERRTSQLALNDARWAESERRRPKP